MKQLQVDTHFGPKLFTREQYIARWTECVTDLFHLGWEGDDFKWLDSVKARVEKMAGAQFDRNWERQESEKRK